MKKPKRETEAAPIAKSCLSSWTVTRGSAATPLQSPPASAPERYPARAIDPGKYTAAAAVSHFQWQQRPILWFENVTKEIVVDTLFSADLTLVDVPKMSQGESIALGTLRESAKGFAPRELLMFLTYANVLRVYWHLEGSLCIEKESTDNGAYRAELSGQHVYYTSKKYSPSFAFVFELKETGELRVTRG